MESNGTCSTCHQRPVESFCICEDLPAFCAECRAVHETKVDFHFSLPLSALGTITLENQQAFRTWLLCLRNSQGKLKPNLREFEKCRADLEAVFRNVHLEVDSVKDKMLRTLETLETAVKHQVEAALRETSANAYRADYQPSSYLPCQVWAHGSQQSSLPIKVFEYQVQPDWQALEHSLGVAFQSPIPELADLNYDPSGGKEDLKVQLDEMKKALETETARAAQYENQLEDLKINIGKVVAEKDSTQVQLGISVEIQKRLDAQLKEIQAQLQTQIKKHEDSQKGQLRLSETVKEKQTQIATLTAHLKEMQDSDQRLSGRINQLEVSLEERERQCQELIREKTTMASTVPAAPNYFASVYRSKVQLYDLATGELTTHELTVNLGDGGAYAQLDASTLLCVGAHPASVAVYELRLPSCQLVSMFPLNTPRCAPGIVQVEARIYVFGGRDKQLSAFKTCEKMQLSNKRWSSLRNEMFRVRSHFTPCLHNSLVYLPSCRDTDNKAVESFDPETETFNLLNVQLPEKLVLGKASVCFVANEELCLLTLGQQMARLRLESEVEFRLSATDRVCCSTQKPLVLGSLVFIACNGGIQLFTLETYSFSDSLA